MGDNTRAVSFRPRNGFNGIQLTMSNLDKLFRCGTFFIVFTCASASIFAQDGENKEGQNPIGKFFRNLNMGVREGADELERAKQGRDQLDARPPQNQDSVRRLGQAKSFLEQKRWHDAVTILQFLIESDSDSFLWNENRELVSLHAEVERMLSTLPNDAKRNLLNRFEAVATRELEAAIKKQDNDQLNRIAHVYLETQAGQSAASQSALNLRDTGHLSSAYRLYTKLARTTESQTKTQRIASLAAQTASDAGDASAVEEISTQFSLTEIFGSKFQFEAASNQFDMNAASTQAISLAHTVPFEVTPQFIPLWTQSTVDRFLVEDQIKQLYSDLREAGRAIAPTSHAILLKNRIAYRTLRGLEVRDCRTGDLIWETRATTSIETQLADPDNENPLTLRNRGRVPEHHPIASLLLRDGISRSLTTDGRHLFAIEGHEILSNPSRGYAWQRRMKKSLAESEKWTTNEIVAYDFESGRVRWRLGGKILEEPFSRPLAGTFFFGPPVSDGSELFVIGERDGAVSLFSIDDQTGELLWSQEIAVPSRSVADDQIRRFWPCFPVVKDGVIVCPTTCGWLVAVDRASHQLLWASRYSPRQSKRRRTRGGFAVQSIQDLNRRWLSSPPVIVGNKVLVTPSEVPDEFGNRLAGIHCLDLKTGAELWRHDKGDGIYLAGIDNNNAIIVGQATVIARNLDASGDHSWVVPFQDIEGKPSGRGVILNRQLLIPVAGKKLVRIDLESGKIISTLKLASSEIDLSHLYYHDESLFSLSTFNLSAFPVRKLTDTERRNLHRNVVSELVAIESLVSNQQYSQALDSMQKLRSLSLIELATLRESERLRELEWTAMEQIVLTDEELATETLLALQTFAETPEELARYKRLAADRKLAAGDWKTALQHYLTLLEQAPREQLFKEESRTIRIDSWVGGRIKDLYDKSSSNRKKQILATVNQHVNRRKKLGDQNRLGRTFYYLPVGQRIELQLALTAIQEKKFSEALVRLQRVTHSEDPALAVTAWSQMADIFSQIDAVSDARRCWLRVLGFPPVKLPDEQGESHDLARKFLKASTAKTDEALLPRSSWGDEWEAVRTGSRGREQSVTVFKPVGTSFDFMKQYRMLFNSQKQRLRIEQIETGNYVWSLPLRSMTNISHRSYVGTRHAGSICYAVHKGAVHALQFPDRKIAWTYTPSVTGMAVSKLRSPAQRGTSMMNNPTSFRNMHNFKAYTTPTGILLAANEYCVLILDDELRALDPLTGDFLWSESETSKRSTAQPINDQMLLIDSKQASFVRSLDGRKTGKTLTEQFLTDCLNISKDQCIQITQSDAEEKDWKLTQGSIKEPASDWSLDIEASAMLSKIDNQSLAMVTSNGELFLIDLVKGEQRLIGFIPGDLMKIKKRIYIYSDKTSLYLAVAHGDARTSYVNLPSLRASGTLLAFSKTEGLLWSQATQELGEIFNAKADQDDAKEMKDEKKAGKKETKWAMNLIVKEFEHSPLLIFISDRPENRNKVYYRRLLMVGLDKRTGERVFDWHRISNSGGFSYLHVDVFNRFIDLRTYNERLRIQPVQRPKVNADGAGE